MFTTIKTSLPRLAIVRSGPSYGLRRGGRLVGTRWSTSELEKNSAPGEGRESHGGEYSTIRGMVEERLRKKKIQRIHGLNVDGIVGCQLHFLKKLLHSTCTYWALATKTSCGWCSFVRADWTQASDQIAPSHHQHQQRTL